MKKWLLGIVLILLIAVGLLLIPSLRYGLLSLALPDFPDWQEPQSLLHAEDQGEIYFPTTSPFDLQVIFAGMTHATPTTGLGYLSYPPTATEQKPVPAMIILPGSGGITPGREHAHAQFLTAQGIAAFVIEYYAPRGLSKTSAYLLKTASVTEFDLIADAYAALQLLSTSPLIDANRIGVMGFSYGGMASRLAMDARFRSILLAPDSDITSSDITDSDMTQQGFAVHIDIYGPCFQNLGTKTTTGAPLLTLRGTEDASNELVACGQREKEIQAAGSHVETHIYAGAGHAWENETPRFFSGDSPYITGCELRYDAAGRPMLNEEPIIEYVLDASRAQKITARLASGAQFLDCVKYGYLIGRDEQTRTNAYTDLLSFLRKHL